MPKGIFEYPQEMKKKSMEDYILITEHNRKDMSKLGRIYYVIGNYSTPVLYAKFCVYPCLRPNKTLVVSGDSSTPLGNYSVQCRDGQDFEDWKNGFDSVISKFIKEKKLFVNKKEKVATFEWK